MKKTSEINASAFHKFTVPVTLIFVLVLGFIALLCLFILQQIYFLGALSKQIDSSQMTTLINNIFRQVCLIIRIAVSDWYLWVLHLCLQF